MLPYNFSVENYTDMGYVTEGGQLTWETEYFLKSGVFSLDQYFKELQNIFQDIYNDGRKYYSVAESSFDTWLDGYVSGTP